MKPDLHGHQGFLPHIKLTPMHMSRTCGAIRVQIREFQKFNVMLSKATVRSLQCFIKDSAPHMYLHSTTPAA